LGFATLSPTYGTYGIYVLIPTPLFSMFNA